MSNTTDGKTVRISVSIAPHILARFDEIADRHGMDRPGLLAAMVNTFYHNPTMPWKQTEPKQDDGDD